MSTIVTINKVPLSAINYKGQRVVTFAQIDAVHGRTEGTAKRNFNKNKDRLKDGVHYTSICWDEIRTGKFSGHVTPKTRNLHVITERGYLMLVKSFTDDLAWEVQDKLVEAYFAPGRSMGEAQAERASAEAIVMAAIAEYNKQKAIASQSGANLGEWRRNKSALNTFIEGVIDTMQLKIPGVETKQECRDRLTFEAGKISGTLMLPVSIKRTPRQKRHDGPQLPGMEVGAP